MIRAKIKLHQLVFLRESTTEPGDGTILIAWDTDSPRYWWVFDRRYDGVEYFDPAPEHRIVDPLSIRPGEKSLDYAPQHSPFAHKRTRLTKEPVKLLAALERAKKQQQPRIVIRPRRWKVIFWRVKRCGLRAWRKVKSWFQRKG